MSNPDLPVRICVKLFLSSKDKGLRFAQLSWLIATQNILAFKGQWYNLNLILTGFQSLIVCGRLSISAHTIFN